MAKEKLTEMMLEELGIEEVLEEITDRSELSNKILEL